MKKLLLITALAVSTGPALAEGPAGEMKIAPEVIISTANGAADQIWVAPFMGLVMLCVLLCGAGSGVPIPLPD